MPEEWSNANVILDTLRGIHQARTKKRATAKPNSRANGGEPRRLLLYLGMRRRLSTYDLEIVLYHESSSSFSIVASRLCRKPQGVLCVRAESPACETVICGPTTSLAFLSTFSFDSSSTRAKRYSTPSPHEYLLNHSFRLANALFEFHPVSAVLLYVSKLL